VPIVGTAVGLVAEVSSQAAVAVPPGDAEALARGFLSLLSDEEQRMSLGHKAQKFARMHDANWSVVQLEAYTRRRLAAAPLVGRSYAWNLVQCCEKNVIRASSTNTIHEES
jgi:glycosyltransferase involved in cell wall biosynthesis